MTFKNLKIAITDKTHLKAVCDIPCRTLGNIDKEYFMWKDVIKRCYSKSFKAKHPTYEDCTISSEWMYYSKFKSDVSSMVGRNINGCQIDKDILIKGNKHYSKETCCLLPPEINSFFVNRCNFRGDYPVGVDLHNKSGLFRSRVRKDGKVKTIGYFKSVEDAFVSYKKEKEMYARVLAEKWRGLIDDRAYIALMNHIVNIDD